MSKSKDNQDRDLLVLSEKQKEAFEGIRLWATTPHPVVVLSGYAGTGKTFLVRKLCQILGSAECAFTAPTNKATKVLTKTLKPLDPKCKTIYSLLGIRMKENQDSMELTFPDEYPELADLSYVFVDEASMLNESLLTYMVDRYPHLKWIFIGDRAQLPPVGEEVSPVWGLEEAETYGLTQVMRHDNQILTLATTIRNCITDYPNTKLTLGPNNDGKEGVFRFRANTFEARIQKLAKNGRFVEFDHTKVIAWRNKTVDRYNRLIRTAYFGAKADDNPYIVGDVLMVASPVMKGDWVDATIDEEGRVESVNVAPHLVYPDLDCYHLMLRMEDGRSVRVSIVHKDSAVLLDLKLNALAETARSNPRGAGKVWKTFWSMKGAFHLLRYSYAITAHRAQGSTYVNVFVDTQDVLANQDRYEALRCLYVAVTRASTRVVLN